MHGFDDDSDDDGFDFDEIADAPLEARVWQLLLLINPGDEDMALQAFEAYRDEASAEDDEEATLERIARVIDWRSGFRVEAHDPRTLVQALDELAARWNLTVDWGGDPDDDDFLAGTDVPALLGIAADRLAESGYTVWVWQAGPETYAGWMSLAHDDEPLREVAASLGIALRPAREVS